MEETNEYRGKELQTPLPAVDLRRKQYKGGGAGGQREKGGACGAGDVGATQVLKYEGGAFTTHPVGATVDNFPVTTGRGYFVRCAAATTWNVTR